MNSPRTPVAHEPEVDPRQASGLQISGLQIIDLHGMFFFFGQDGSHMHSYNRGLEVKVIPLVQNRTHKWGVCTTEYLRQSFQKDL